MSFENNFPMDFKILRPWLNIVRRLRLAAAENKGKISILTVRILIDQEGAPVHYAEPECVRIEPRANNLILRIMAGDGPQQTDDQA